MIFRRKKVKEPVIEPDFIIEEITLKTAEDILRAMALALAQSETPKMCYSVKVYSDGGQEVRLDEDTWYRKRPNDFWTHSYFENGNLKERREMSWLELMNKN